MPGDKESIPSSSLELWIAPPNGQALVPLGIAESVAPVDNFGSELLHGLGRPDPFDSVVNIVDGEISWGRVHQLDPAVLENVMPVLARFGQFKVFDIIAVDPNDGKPIFRAVGITPQSLQLDGQNGRALRENYRALCRFVKHGRQVTQH